MWEKLDLLTSGVCIIIKSTIKSKNEKIVEPTFEFYKDLYENSPDMIVVGDHSDRLIIGCNQTFLTRLGYTYDEIMNISSYKVIYHPDCYEYLEDFIEEYARQGYANNVELALRTKSGEKIPVSLSITGVKDEQGVVTFSRAVFRDMTELINARNEIANQMEKYRQKSEELEKRNQDLDTFVHLVAHDLRAPLRSISSLVFFMKEDTENKLSDESTGYLNSLEKKIANMGKLMNDIIFYFLLNNEVRALETVNLKDFINNIENVLPIPPGFSFVLQSEVKELVIHKLPLQQVLHNLFNNAIKHHHTPPIGKVIIDVQETTTDYIFLIKDNGPGIPFQYRDYIFEAFKTLNARDSNDGNGLGLAIVKRIVNQEGGDISLLSQEEELGTTFSGTTFRVRWPKLQDSSKN